MSYQTSQANDASGKDQASTHPVLTKAGNIARRNSLVPIALQNELGDETNYRYQSTPTATGRSDAEISEAGDSCAQKLMQVDNAEKECAGTSHVNMKIVRHHDSMFDDTQEGNRSSTAASGSKLEQVGDKANQRQTRSETTDMDLDAMLDDEGEWFEETLNRVSAHDHAMSGGDQQQKK